MPARMIDGMTTLAAVRLSAGGGGDGVGNILNAQLAPELCETVRQHNASEGDRENTDHWTRQRAA